MTLRARLFKTALLAGVSAFAAIAAAAEPPSVQAAAPGRTPRYGVPLARLQTAYNFDPLYRLGYTGQGQTIAVVEGAADPAYLSHNMRLFDARYKLPPIHVRYIYPQGKEVSPRWNGEDSLDLSLIHGLVPGAAIEVIVDKNPINSFLYILTHHLSKIVSYSANTVESRFTRPQVLAYNNVLARMAAQGIGIYKGIGDWGALDNNPKAWPNLDNSRFKVNFPASSPWVTAVGGTTLFTAASGAYRGESVWPKTGGGFSEWFRRPTWQHGPGIPSSQKQRGIPDVAFDANPKTGLQLYENGRLVAVGGDSAGGPAWATIAALANEVAGHPLGFLNPRLYAIARSPDDHLAFHDVVRGSNGYPARPGWDPATGLGSPNVYQLVRLLTKGPGGTIPARGSRR